LSNKISCVDIKPPGAPHAKWAKFIQKHQRPTYSIPDQSAQEQNSPEDHTDKKENLDFLTYKEIQIGAVAKSYMTNGLLIYG
jgi:hypothetical protein